MLLVLPTLVAAEKNAPVAPDAAVVNAVWVEHDITLNYMGFTSYYSCDGLREKVRWVLGQLGARPDFKVTARGCVRVTGPEAMPSLKIIAAMPAAATPELLAQLAAEASKQELAARVQGRSPAAPEATAQFPARAKRVEFRSNPVGDLREGDCELMEQLRDQAFGPLGVKVVEDRIRCVPKQVSLGSVQMTVEVLQPVPQS
jgi:hypothetical protein